MTDAPKTRSEEDPEGIMGRMKHELSVALLLSVVFALPACGSGSGSTARDSGSSGGSRRTGGADQIEAPSAADGTIRTFDKATDDFMERGLRQFGIYIILETESFIYLLTIIVSKMMEETKGEHILELFYNLPSKHWHFKNVKEEIHLPDNNLSRYLKIFEKRN